MATWSVFLQELPYVCKRAAIWAVARYLTRKVIERYLTPYMKKLAAENPSLTLSKPSVQFDIVQRAARAVFAVIIVSRCILWMMRDHSAELAAEYRKYGWPIPPRNSVYEGLGPAPLSARTICYDLFGWYLTDTLDLFLLKRRFGVVQWDIAFHHFAGMVLLNYWVVVNRGAGILVSNFTGEALVPVGVTLWWLKSIGSNSKWMYFVRLLGFCVLAFLRIPMWTYALRRTFLTDNWGLRTGALTDPSALGFLVLHFIGYYLDIGWIKLYLDGLRQRPPKIAKQ